MEKKVYFIYWSLGWRLILSGTSQASGLSLGKQPALVWVKESGSRIRWAGLKRALTAPTMGRAVSKHKSSFTSSGSRFLSPLAQTLARLWHPQPLEALWAGPRLGLPGTQGQPPLRLLFSNWSQSCGRIIIKSSRSQSLFYIPLEVHRPVFLNNYGFQYFDVLGKENQHSQPMTSWILLLEKAKTFGVFKKKKDDLSLKYYVNNNISKC